MVEGMDLCFSWHTNLNTSLRITNNSFGGLQQIPTPVMAMRLDDLNIGQKM